MQRPFTLKEQAGIISSAIVELLAADHKSTIERCKQALRTTDTDHELSTNDYNKIESAFDKIYEDDLN